MFEPNQQSKQIFLQRSSSEQSDIQGLDSELKFVLILTFPSQIATLLASAHARGRLAYDVAQTESDN